LYAGYDAIYKFSGSGLGKKFRTCCFGNNNRPKKIDPNNAEPFYANSGSSIYKVLMQELPFNLVTQVRD